jgi:hypothetical protein
MPSFTLVSFQVTTISNLLNFLKSLDSKWTLSVFESTCLTRLKQFHTKTLFLTHLSLEPRVFHNAIMTQIHGWKTLIGWNSTINCWNSEGNKSLTIELNIRLCKLCVFFLGFVLFFCRLISVKATKVLSNAMFFFWGQNTHDIAKSKPCFPNSISHMLHNPGLILSSCKTSF